MKSIKDFNPNAISRKKLVVDGIMVGIVSGFCSVSYRLALQYISHFRFKFLSDLSDSKIYIWFGILLISSFIVHLLLKFEPMSSGSGIPQIQGEMHGVFDTDSKKIILSKFVGGSLASLGGLSLGREGPSIQIGANAAKIWAKLMKRTPSETGAIMSAGASAGLSAAFNAPISGVIFVLEELHKTYSSLLLIPALVAAVVADFISKNIFGLAPAFHFEVAEVIQLSDYYHLLIFAIIAALIGILFNHTLLKVQDIFNAIKIKKPIVLAFVFCVSGLIAIYTVDLSGGGHSLIESLLNADKAFSLLIILLVGKLLFTSFCYGSSVQGGIFFTRIGTWRIGRKYIF
ncbi:MAG: chloride channel protein [Tissierellia bacterium]|nr:chloride channel protein [Tissierellia bacterium]